MLKSNDPRIDLCGISEGRSWNIMLNLLLNLFGQAQSIRRQIAYGLFSSVQV